MLRAENTLIPDVNRCYHSIIVINLVFQFARVLTEVSEFALLVQCKEILSVVKDIEEALIQLLLPQLAFRSNADDDQALVWTRVNIHEFAILRLTALFKVLKEPGVVVGDVEDG